MSSPIDHTPPQEDIELKPNPGYGVSTSEEICVVLVMYPEAIAAMSSVSGYVISYRPHPPTPGGH